MRKTALFIVFFLFFLPLVFARGDESSEKTNYIGIGSIFYQFDISFDRLLYQIGLKTATTVANERISELQESDNTEDIKGINMAAAQLREIELHIEDENTAKNVETELESLEQEFEISPDETKDIINNDPDLTKMLEMIGDMKVGVQTTGIIEKKYIVTINDGKILSIEEVPDLGDLPYLTIEYSEIIESLKNEETKNRNMKRVMDLIAIRDIYKRG